MEDYSCVYPKHQCELKTQQKMSRAPRRSLLQLFKKASLISQKNYRSYWFLRTTGAIQQELTRQKLSRQWYIIHPFSLIRLFWEIFMIVNVVFCTIFFPMRSGFLNSLITRYYLITKRSVNNVYISLLIALAVDILWMMDTFFNFFTGYYDSTAGKVIMDHKIIVKNYVTQGFIFDITSCLPIEPFIALFFGMETYGNLSQIHFAFLQIYNFYSTIRFRHYIRYCCEIGSLGNLAHLTLRLVFAFVVYFWIINWSIYVSLIVPQIVYGEALLINRGESPVSWAEAEGLFQKPFWEQYKAALMKSIFTNIGVSSWSHLYAVDDFIMAVIICISGRIYWVYFLVWFLEAVSGANALRVKFLLILEQLKTYMKEKEIPMFLKKRLNRFYFYRFQAHYFRDRAILGRLTESLRKEISVHTCQRLIHNTEVFQSLPKRVVARLVQRMHREMYFPNDVIIRANTFGECMYFICSGTVAVWTPSEKEICRLEDGEFFGEIALIVEERRRTATITAVTITELYRLEASDYKKIIHLYPDVYHCLEKFAASRIKTLVAMESKTSR